MLLVTFTTVQRMTSQFSCQNVASDLLRPRPGIRTLHNADTILSALLVTSFSTNSKFRKQRVSLLFQRYIVYPTLLVPHSFTFSCENNRLSTIIANFSFALARKKESNIVEFVYSKIQISSRSNFPKRGNLSGKNGDSPRIHYTNFWKQIAYLNSPAQTVSTLRRRFSVQFTENGR